MVRAIALIAFLSAAPGGYAAEAGPASTPSFSVGAEFFGQDPYPLAARGIRVGYVVAPGHEVEVVYSEAKTSVLMADFRFREYELRHQVSVDSVVQWGYGLGFRDILVDYDVFVTSSAVSEHISEQHQSITGHAHFGFEFCPIEAVAIGSDLLGLSVPLHWTKNTNGFPSDSRDFEEDPKVGYVSNGFNVSYQLLRTYIKVKF